MQVTCAAKRQLTGVRKKVASMFVFFFNNPCHWQVLISGIFRRLGVWRGAIFEFLLFLERTDAIFQLSLVSTFSDRRRTCSDPEFKPQITYIKRLTVSLFLCDP